MGRLPDDPAAEPPVECPLGECDAELPTPFITDRHLFAEHGAEGRADFLVALAWGETAFRRVEHGDRGDGDGEPEGDG
jgi:hypothetical protein